MYFSHSHLQLSRLNPAASRPLNRYFKIVRLAYMLYLVTLKWKISIFCYNNPQ